MKDIHEGQVEPATTKTLETQAAASVSGNFEWKDLPVRGHVTLRELTADVPHLWDGCPPEENGGRLPLFGAPVIEPRRQPGIPAAPAAQHPAANHPMPMGVPVHAVLLLLTAAVATVVPLLGGEVSIAAVALAVLNVASVPTACAACHRARRHCPAGRCRVSALLVLACIGAALALMLNLDGCDATVPETVGAGLIQLCANTANRRI